MKSNWETYKKHPLSLVFFFLVCGAVIITIGILLVIVTFILVRGVPYLTSDLFAREYTTENSSMLPAIVTTLEMVAIALIVAVPLGVSCAIYLVEYAGKGNRLIKVIRITTETLSGIPSIVYGLFGMLLFVNALGWGYSLLAGSLTVAIMILPLIIRSTEEALKSVDDSHREGSYGLGAGKLRTVFKIVLPSSINGIVAGIILAIGRIIGETAALMYTAGTIARYPKDVFSSARTLSIHMYSLSREALHMNESAATAVVLLVIVFGLNSLASFAAKKLKSKA